MQVDEHGLCAADRYGGADISFALHVLLFARLLDQVPDALTFTREKQRRQDRLTLDHGALRTVAERGSPNVLGGRAQIARFLEPLGYVEAAVYPLDRLRMTGYAYRHRRFPEAVPQFFVSELHPDRFSPGFQKITGDVMSTLRDPLTQVHQALLARVGSGHALDLSEARALTAGLAAAFGRHHDLPRWAQYQALREESAEMAWISTEGQTFNHATARTGDIQADIALAKQIGLDLKADVEVSASGRVLQTAVRAAQVMRQFKDDDAPARAVPGSFFEFIERKALPAPGPEGETLDLSFDSSNAQGIFVMTSGSKPGR
jgi:hypothetical protein